jgi:hypothetical protein
MYKYAWRGWDKAGGYQGGRPLTSTGSPNWTPPSILEGTPGPPSSAEEDILSHFFCLDLM